MRKTSAQSITNPRYLVYAGVFTALYFVITFGSGMLGIISPLMIIVGALIGVVCNGVVVMLYIAKTPYFGALTITGTIVGFLMMATGHTWYVSILGLAMGFLADLIANSGHYRRRITNCLAYAVLNLWSIAPIAPIFYNSDAYFAHVQDSMSAEYAEAMQHLLTPTVLICWMVLTFIISFVAANVGMNMLKKQLDETRSLSGAQGFQSQSLASPQETALIRGENKNPYGIISTPSPQTQPAAYDVIAEEIREPESLNLNDLGRQMVEKALERNGGNRKKAAQELGISDRTLYRRIKQYGLDKSI